jgi:hypothetical protein
MAEPKEKPPALSAPVGEKGKWTGPINRPGDVKLVRKLLNPQLKKLGYPGIDETSEKSDPRLIKAIRTFQRRRLRLLWEDEKGVHKSPAYDGRIDPDDETFLALVETDTAKMPKRPVIGEPACGLVLAASSGKEENEFVRGAKAFCSSHKKIKRWVPIDNATEGDYRGRAAATFEALDEAEDGTLDAIAFFGHGQPTFLPSFGLFTGDIGRLGDRIKAKCKARSAILLYACSAGAFGGFAEKLAAAVNSGGSTTKDCRVVYGHLVDGHAYQGAYYTYFPGRRYVVSPTVPLFGVWQKKIMGSDLWARFPFMSDDDLSEELQPT